MSEALPKDSLSNVPQVEGSIQLVVHIKPQSGKEAEVAEWLRKIQAHSNSDAEPDTTVYRVSESVTSPKYFLVYEEYASAAAMGKHAQGEDFKKFFSKSKELIEVLHPRWFTKL
ncbi:unnamed protein product [Parajaminaea phylloscopi]